MSLLVEKSAGVVYATVAFVPILTDVGDFTIAGNLIVLGTTTLEGEVTVDNNLIVTGTTTLEGEVTVDNNLIVTGTTTLNGEVTVDNSLIVTGTTTLNGEVTVDNNLIVTGTTTLNGEVTVDNNLIVTGTSTLNGEVTVDNNLIVTGTTTLNGEVTVDNNLIVTGTSTLNGEVTVDNNLIVTGTTTLDGEVTINNDLTVTGTTTFTNTLNVTTVGGEFFDSVGIVVRGSTTGGTNMLLQGIFDTAKSYNVIDMAIAPIVSSSVFGYDATTGTVWIPNDGVFLITNNMFPQENSTLTEASFTFNLFKNAVLINSLRIQYTGDGSYNLDSIVTCLMGDALTTSFTSRSDFDGTRQGSYMLLRKIK